MGEANSNSDRPVATSALSPTLTPEAVRNQLSVLLRQPTFADSERSKQLMEYLVERALRGEAGNLKEYVIAADVFGRHSDFDPKLDSVVRAQVSRLRTKLVDYYQSDGRYDPVRFDLPRRGYALQLQAGARAELVAIAPPSESRQARHKRPYYWMAGMLAAIAIVAIAISALHRPSPAARMVSLTRLMPQDPPIFFPSLSRDGKLLSYSLIHENGSSDLYVQHVGGGPPLKILGPRFVLLQSIAPDGSRIVFSAFENGGGTYIIPTLGGAPRRIAPLGHLPGISPDGNWVLYGRYGPDRRKIYMVSSDGGEPRQLHPEFDLAQWAMWAPDGKSYFFNGRRHRGEETDYWVSSLDGTRLVAMGLLHKLTALGLARTVDTVWVMQWVKDRLYAETTDGDEQKVWRIDIDPKTWRLTEMPQQVSSFLAFQPQVTVAEDGRLVVADILVRYSDWIIPLDSNAGKVTGKATPVTGDIAAAPLEFLSDDGRHIVYATNSRGQARYWLKNIISGSESIIQTTPGPQRVRAISRDASRLYYENGAAPETTVYRAELPDGAAQMLCDRCTLVALSADETTMLSSPPGTSGGLVLRHLDTGIITQLLPPGVRTSFTFSPDGKWLAFQVPTDYLQSRIVIVPVRNSLVPPSDFIVVAEGSAMNRSPAWSSNGRLLYFTSNRDGPTSVWAQRLDSRTGHPVDPPLDVYRDDAPWAPWDPGHLSVAADKMLLRRNRPTSGLWTGQLP